MTRFQRIPCEWVIATTKGPRACTFQGAMTVLGHGYCKTHAKLVKKLRPSEEQVQGAKLAAEERIERLKAQISVPKEQRSQVVPGGVGPTSESLEVAQAILVLTKQGASANAVAFLIDGYVTNVMRKTLTPKKVA